MTKVISSYINYETRKNGFISSKRLSHQILDIFNEEISTTRIRIELKILSMLKFTAISFSIFLYSLIFRTFMETCSQMSPVNY